MSDVDVREIWTVRDGVKLHAVEWRPRGGVTGTPILSIGGAITNAWSAETLGVAAASGKLGPPRRVVSPDRRGMGASDAPPTGYTTADFSKDNEAVMLATGLDSFVVFGRSLGVPIAIAYALAHRARVRGLILGDYAARWPRLTDEWLATVVATFHSFVGHEAAFQGASRRTGDEARDRERFARIWRRYFRERDGRIEEMWSRDALTQMQRESVETSFWDDLATLDMPVLAITGTDGVLLKPDDAERYRKACGAGSLVTIDGADHSLTVNGDRSPFFAVLRRFLADIDDERTCAE